AQYRDSPRHQVSGAAALARRARAGARSRGPGNHPGRAGPGGDHGAGAAPAGTRGRLQPRPDAQGLGTRLHRGGPAPDPRQRQPGGQAPRHQPHDALQPDEPGGREIAVALYLEHFGLDEPPFRITPHTDFFFDGAERGATLEALAYAMLHDEGIVKVSGEVGSGKTMLCRMLMERLPAEVETIYLATPSLARDEILHAIADDLQLKLSERRSVALRELQEHLIELYGAGRRVVVLIDE